MMYLELISRTRVGPESELTFVVNRVHLYVGNNDGIFRRVLNCLKWHYIITLH